MHRPPFRRALALSLLAVTGVASASAVGRVAFGAESTVPTSSPSSPPTSAPKAKAGSNLPKVAVPLVTEHSIYIPCYAMVPLSHDLADDWMRGRTSCYLLKKNETISLAAPLHIPATNGKTRLRKLRCFAYSDHGGDEIHYTASVEGNPGTLARLEVVQKKLDPAEDAAKAKADFDDIDPLARHYDLSVSWRVAVPAGDGWLPKANELRGCRVDYVVVDAG